MQRKPKAPQEEKAPSPAFVVMVSLFGYPGAGHLMLGKKRAGVIFATLFTLATLGVLYEIWFLVPEILKLMRQVTEMQEALTIPELPNLPRIGLWIVLTGGIWVVCAIHSGLMAQRVAKDWPKPKPTSSDSQVGDLVGQKLESPERAG